MEQRLDATFLRPGLIHRGSAVGFGAAGIGAGIFLAARRFILESRLNNSCSD
jgi:hypothetical protein